MKRRKNDWGQAGETGGRGAARGRGASRRGGAGAASGLAGMVAQRRQELAEEKTKPRVHPVPPMAQGAVGQFLQPFEEFIPESMAAAQESMDEMGRSLERFHDPGLL